MNPDSVDPPVAAPVQVRRDWIEIIWVALAPIIGRLSVALLLALGALWLFVVLAHQVSEQATERVDQVILHFFHVHPQATLHQIMRDITWLGGLGPQSVLVAGALLYYLIRRRFWPHGASLLLAAGGGAGVITLLKWAFHRARPDPIYTKLGYSFPSGHSFFSLVIYGMLAYLITLELKSATQRRLVWTLAGIAIFLVGFSRVFLGEHYPSDVAAGFAAGFFWLWGCLVLPATFAHRADAAGDHALTPDELRARYAAAKQTLKETAHFIPNLIKLTGRLLRDPRVPRSQKIALGLLAGYLALPFDLVPDFIPVIGVADDLILVALTLNWVAKAVPRALIEEHWDGETSLFALLDRVGNAINQLRYRARAPQ